MRALDFAGADRKSLGHGLGIFQLVFSSADIAMASPDRRRLVARLGRFAMGSEGTQDLVDPPALQRVLLRRHPGSASAGLWRDPLGGVAKIFTNMIKIDQDSFLVRRTALRLGRRSRARR